MSTNRLQMVKAYTDTCGHVVRPGVVEMTGGKVPALVHDVVGAEGTDHVVVVNDDANAVGLYTREAWQDGADGTDVLIWAEVLPAHLDDADDYAEGHALTVAETVADLARAARGEAHRAPKGDRLAILADVLDDADVWLVNRTSDGGYVLDPADAWRMRPCEHCNTPTMRERCDAEHMPEGVRVMVSACSDECWSAILDAAPDMLDVTK